MNNAEFGRPIPKALDDAALELALAEAKLSPDGLVAAMMLLEQQEQLRRTDDEALAAWQSAQAAGSEHNKDDEPDGPSDDFPFEPISASEVTVTTTLNQIVADVNEAFIPIAAAEEVTALEEQEQSVEPKSPADELVAMPASDAGQALFMGTKSSMHFDWKSLSLPVLVGGTFAGSGSGFATIAIGLAGGALMSWLFTLSSLMSERRSSSSHQIMSRATFGVWGAVLPGAVHLGVRIVVLLAVVAWASSNQLRSFGAADAALGNGVTISTVIAAAGIAILCVLGIFKRVSRIAQAVFSSLALTLVVATGALNFAGFNEASPDLTAAATIAAAYLVIDALILGPARRTTNPSSFSNTVRSSAVRQLLPALVASLALGTLFSIVSRAPSSSGDVVYQFLVDMGFLPILLAVVAIAVELLRRLGEDFAALRFTKLWSTAITAAIGVGVLLFFGAQLPQLLAEFNLVVAAFSIAATVPYLTETLMRSGNFHEVSLQRGYAFYRRFGLAAVLGYIVVGVFGFLASPYGAIGDGSLGFVLTPILGPATPVVYMLVFSASWTLATSWVRIRHQQNEVMALERRRNEIAGFDVFE
ncbi:MAG: hypothetical protein EBY26_02105 [Microbacteriaceae bacterium]|nr:hypothetical protein [Microbacteriaceae bacterium]